MLENIASRANRNVKQIIAREIMHFPNKQKHQLFETLSLEDCNTIKKYRLWYNRIYYYMKKRRLKA